MGVCTQEDGGARAVGCSSSGRAYTLGRKRRGACARKQMRMGRWTEAIGRKQIQGIQRRVQRVRPFSPCLLLFDSTTSYTAEKTCMVVNIHLGQHVSATGRQTPTVLPSVTSAHLALLPRSASGRDIQARLLHAAALASRQVTVPARH